MATDATGTVTSPDNIPKFNIGVDAPTGNGTNAMMDQLQAIISGLRNGTAPGGKIQASSALTATGTPSASTYLAGDDTWKTISAGGGTPVTALPGSPTDEQNCILVDSTSAPTYAWHLQYSTAAGKWLFIGGTRYKVAPSTASSTSGSGVWEDKGAVFTFPAAGDYEVEVYGRMVGQAAASGSTYGVGFSSPPTIQAPVSFNLTDASSSGSGLITATASQVLHGYFTDADSTRRNQLSNIRVYVTPVTLS